MKVFIPFLCLVSLALAEPPVGNGYAAARSSHDESDHQRPLSQEYGPPSDTFSSARNAPSDGYDYNAPSSRSSLNTRGQSNFPPATVRVSFNQRFSSAAARSSAQDSTASLSQEHAAPNARSGISQQYGPPAAKSLSEEYGVPSVVSARTLSTEYGMPDARSTPSQEYGVPVVAGRSNQKSASPSTFRSAQPAKGFSQMPARSQFQRYPQSNMASARSSNVAQDFDASKPFSRSAPATRNAPSLSYGTPSLRSHDVSSARNANSQGSQDYSASNERLSENNGAQEYGVPSSRANQMTDAIPSSFASARSSPSSLYLPAARNAAPSEQYGVPEQRIGANQGYDYARTRALAEELMNQEPASYDFGYQIEDQESGSDFGHTETREENRAQGSYFVVLPDGSKQTVEYEADERGYKPRISVEPAAGGYDENAAELASARAAGGPY